MNNGNNYDICLPGPISPNINDLITYRQTTTLSSVVAPSGVQTDLYLPTPFLVPTSPGGTINVQAPTAPASTGTTYFPPEGECYYGPDDTYHTIMTGTSTYQPDTANGAVLITLGPINLLNQSATIDLLCTVKTQDVLSGNQVDSIPIATIWDYNLIGASPTDSCYRKTSYYAFTEGVAELRI